MTAVAIAAVPIAAVPMTADATPARSASPGRGYYAPAPLRTSPAPAPAAYRKREPLGDPTPLACTVARIALEVALGGSGIDQLTRWVTPTVRTSLLRQHSLAQRASYRPRGDIGIARVRLCRVSPSAVEAAVVAKEGDLAHALAMRLEAVAGRWLVTVLDVG